MGKRYLTRALPLLETARANRFAHATPLPPGTRRILDLLDRMIEEEEQRESSSSSGGGGGKNSPGRQSPSNPMQESRLPGGSAKEGPLRERRRANPAEAWGSMPPAERERILQALRDSFPSRYRKLVEQYYEELAKKP